MAIEDNSCPHRCLKITLRVLYSIVIAISIIYLAQAVILQVALSNIDDDHTYKDYYVFMLINAIGVLALMLLFHSIALFAIVKEKKYILAVFTALQVMCGGLFLWKGYLFTAIGDVVMATMLGVFTYIVFKRQKLRQSVASKESC